MAKKISKFLLSATTAAVLLLGCNDPFAPNGPGEVKLSAKLNNGLATQALSALPVWTSGKVIITNIKFEYQGPDEIVVQSIDAASTIDLATGIATPALPTITLNPGLYKKALFKMHLKPDALNFEINGTWQENNIKIENDHQEPVHAKTEEFLVEPGKVYGVNIVIKPNTLLNNPEITDAMLQNAAKDSNGTILISKASNTDLYNTYIKNKLDTISSFEQTVN